MHTISISLTICSCQVNHFTLLRYTLEELFSSQYFRYRGYHEGVWPYNFSKQYWEVTAVRLAFVFVFQFTVFFFTNLITKLVPDVPNGFALKTKREKELIKSVFEKKQEVKETQTNIVFPPASGKTDNTSRKVAMNPTDILSEQAIVAPTDSTSERATVAPTQRDTITKKISNLAKGIFHDVTKDLPLKSGKEQEGHEAKPNQTDSDKEPAEVTTTDNDSDPATVTPTNSASTPVTVTTADGYVIQPTSRNVAHAVVTADAAEVSVILITVLE